MKLPTLDLSLIPDIDSASGLFGSLASLAHQAMSGQDVILIIAIYIYETRPSGAHSLFF